MSVQCTFSRVHSEVVVDLYLNFFFYKFKILAD